MSDLKLTLYPYRLNFKFPFKISHGERTGTDVVYIKLQYKDFVGWGEATLPPYLPETQKSVTEFLSGIDLSVIDFPLEPLIVFNRLDNARVGNLSAKAALDMALWNLKSHMEGKPIGELLGINSDKFPLDTYTIGVCMRDEMKLKVEQALAYGFEMFKIKLNGLNDEEMIGNFRGLSSKPFAVDVNQGWRTGDEAIEKIKWLKDEGCVLVEQPLPMAMDHIMPAVLQQCDLPIYADESCQTIEDLERLKDSFTGINIKLMKCGGLSSAFEMIRRARELKLHVLIGCMSESSVGCTTAANLTPLADYADLDGPYLISNDAFGGMEVKEGRIKLNPLLQTNAIGNNG